MDVRTVNLFQKGINEVSYLQDGHRRYSMRHTATDIVGYGWTRQEAYDNLVEAMDG